MQGAAEAGWRESGAQGGFEGGEAVFKGLDPGLELGMLKLELMKLLAESKVGVAWRGGRSDLALG